MESRMHVDEVADGFADLSMGPGPAVNTSDGVSRPTVEDQATEAYFSRIRQRHETGDSPQFKHSEGSYFPSQDPSDGADQDIGPLDDSLGPPEGLSSLPIPLGQDEDADMADPGISDFSNVHAASLPSPPHYSEILATAATLPLTKRFLYLLNHTRNIIHVHGPYHLDNGHLASTAKPKERLTRHRVDNSLTFAQDAINTPQPPGPALSDLKVFAILHFTAILLLEAILESNELITENPNEEDEVKQHKRHNCFGQGVSGLASGYMDEEDQLFAAHKQRLNTSLQTMKELQPLIDRIPQLEREMRGSLDTVNAEAISEWAKASKSWHISATMMLQEMRKDDWEKVRWGPLVRVAETWATHLEWHSREDEGMTVAASNALSTRILQAWEEKDRLWIFKGYQKKRRPSPERRFSTPGVLEGYNDQ